MKQCHLCLSKFESSDSNSLHCSECKEDLKKGFTCDVCNEPKFENIWDSFWHYQVNMMFDGIEILLKGKKAHYLTALALSTYTEIMGGLVTGNLKEKGKSRQNYEAFLPYLGEEYVKLNQELIDKNSSLFEAVRSKLVHEFAPRPSHMIVLSEEAVKTRIGMEYLRDHLNFHLQEYFRDFKKGVEKFRKELENYKEDQTALKNFLNSMVMNSQKSEEEK